MDPKILKQLEALSNKSAVHLNEENVKHHIVIPLLRLLGYDSELDLEVSQGTDRPDILIKGFIQPIVVETKGTTARIQDHLEQIHRYSHTFNALISIITNGHQWLVFSPYWRRSSFVNRLILSFSIDQLNDPSIAEAVTFLMAKSLGLAGITQNLAIQEKNIERIEQDIAELQEKRHAKKKQAETIEQKYPRLNQLKVDIALFMPEIQAELKMHDELQNEIENISMSIRALEVTLPMPQSISSQMVAVQVRPAARPANSIISKPNEFNSDFELGISDEAINILALQRGEQISLCKSIKKNNHHIFLASKVSFNSDFTPSPAGLRLQHGHMIDRNCQYVAALEYLSIPGRNRNFWQAMKDAGEFCLWEIDKGPYEYFMRSQKSKELLWLLRVYLMPFKMIDGRDFHRGPRGNLKVANAETLARVQNGFFQNTFKPVLEAGEYQRRKQEISAIAKRFR